MNKSVLIKRVMMDCPLCDKEHEVEERERITINIVKGEKVEYKERYYYCENAPKDECEFEIGSMMNENLLNARNAYREKYSLLTSHEIVEIRENYGLSQVDLARLLGWGEATISRYESKAIQDEAYDNMLRLVKDNPLQALLFLRKNADKFSDSKRAEIRGKIVEKLELYGKEFLTRQTFESEYAGLEEPSDLNGYAVFDIDKIETVISYIAKNVDKLYKVKLMKMLWYADVLSYKAYNHAITGLIYKHNRMGALPIGHYSLMNLENLNIVEEESDNYNSMFRILPSEKVNYDILSSKEKKIIDKIIKKFKSYTTKEIVEYMHQEIAYQETEKDEIIPFSLAKHISFS